MPRRALDRLNGALMALASVVTVAMMAHVVLDVAGKYLLNQPIHGTLEIVSFYYMVAVLFLPFAYVTRTEGQIIVELFTRRMAPRRLAWLEVGVGLVTLVAMTVFAWKTGAAAVEKTIAGEFRESGVNIIQVWPSRWLPAIAGGSMALVVLFRLIDDFRIATGRVPAGDQPRTKGMGA